MDIFKNVQNEKSQMNLKIPKNPFFDSTAKITISVEYIFFTHVKS